jgi:transcriptional regulator with PAS, ATPase and Fis domain
MHHTLFAWLGTADLNASRSDDPEELGPVAGALAQREFDRLVLMSDHPDETSTSWWQWASAQSRTDTTLHLHKVTLPSPVDYEAIHQAAVAAIEAERERQGADFDPTFHLSPGTPAMAAVWLLLAKTRYDAHLVDSSKEHGLHDVHLPFEIAAEYVPALLRDSERRMARMAEAEAPTEASFGDIVARSRSMRLVLGQARKVAPFAIPVLVQGESGTGKELLAKAIHHDSPRAGKPFIAVNCGALPSELIESTLFGHVKGAFTGADQPARGHFREADGGTLFLDEIGELPLAAQVKLLRVLQEGTIVPVGSATEQKVNVRILAATNRVLADEVAAGRFRADLYYRLAVAVVTLPPLRQREGDVGALIDATLDRLNREHARVRGWQAKKLSAGGRKLLLNHPWPGNVRELIATLTRAAIWSSGPTIRTDDVHSALENASAGGAETILDRPLTDGVDLPDIMATVARHYLERALADADGNKTRAAELLGLPSRQTLTNWLDRYNVT